MQHIMDLYNGWGVTGPNESCGFASIGLDFNPLICDCIDFDFYKYIIHNNSFFPHLLCRNPPNLRNKLISKIPLHEFVCDLKTHCPDKCECKEYPYNVTTVIRCTANALSLLPDMLPALRDGRYKYVLDAAYSNIRKLEHRAYFTDVLRGLFFRNKIDRIEYSAMEALENVDILDLHNNELQALPENISHITFSRNTRQILLSGNPWFCNCNALEYRDWMVSNQERIPDWFSIKCQGPPYMQGKKLLTCDRKLFCNKPVGTSDVIKFVAIGLGTFLLLVIVFIAFPVMFVFKKRVWIYKRTSWHPFDRDECGSENKEFDVFVCYSTLDEDYIVEDLIPELHRQGFKVCFHRLHFDLGLSIITNIDNCIQQSKRTLVYFTESFRLSELCLWEFNVAMEMDARQGTHRLVIIKGADLDLDALDERAKSYFQRFTYVERSSNYYWDNLVYALPLTRMGPDEEMLFAIEGC